VIGGGPGEREVRRYLATRRLGGVELLGRVSDEDKARYFATADVYVSPATGRESFGIVLLEAMAAGCPIICSDIHGYRSVVRRDQQAILVPPRDRDALVAALERVLGDPALRARMRAACLERAPQFGWENVTAKVEAYYGFVIRRLASHGALPADFRAEEPFASVGAPPAA
jgi:phosphatidylinositol alpha-mannosyltransferase